MFIPYFENENRIMQSAANPMPKYLPMDNFSFMKQTASGAVTMKLN
jgi:hypothetical protein